MRDGTAIRVDMGTIGDAADGDRRKLFVNTASTINGREHLLAIELSFGTARRALTVYRPAVRPRWLH